VSRFRVWTIAAIAAAGLSMGLSPLAFADDTDTQFIGEVSFFLPGKYRNPPTIKALITDAKKVRDGGWLHAVAGWSQPGQRQVNSRHRTKAASAAEGTYPGSGGASAG
jgi:hypothetical protein